MPMMHPEDEANSDAPLVPDLRPTNRDRPTRPTDDRTTNPIPTKLETLPQMDQRTPSRRTEPPAERRPPIHRELEAINERLSNIEARLAGEEGRR